MLSCLGLALTPSTPLRTLQVMPNIKAYKQFVTTGSYLLVQDTKTTRCGPGAPPAAAQCHGSRRVWRLNRKAAAARQPRHRLPRLLAVILLPMRAWHGTSKLQLCCDGASSSLLLRMLLCRMGKHHLCNPEGKTLAEFNKCYNEKKHGPLDAVHDFLAQEPAGVWEQDKKREYMLYSQHADGWLKRLK